ncbi:molybdopterin molybdotransferase MoeA [Helicobacter kayseriensis]|uniref:molybdopterin molybdotransferase MoeA n=1 Tax=Helicobacter kayseriensis TaxID=2905877 RepID=UPI001E4686AD|nr:molybdopterin molybdotransferase MoeA [Helicobacter kayseriensis]MCE3047413.1 molybdopterin molybdotransferase MoeA [Helicobacter kayseriensis]MCE3048916.1 molybdopterin molybdotransferase MoeA [Helicobacter kayseriensis]
MISFKNAFEILFSQSLKLKTQQTPLFEATGKILAQDIFTSRNLPAFSNSAMDGYAIASIESSYKIQGNLLAGDHSIPTILPNHCIKIMTGAKIPPNTIAVIPFEHIQTQDSYIIPLFPIKEGQNIKYCGEDYCIGNPLLKQGEQLNYASLALLASQGISTVPTYQSLQIGIFASGNEIKEPWEEAQDFHTFNTNAIAYHAILRDLGFQSQYLGILPDDKQELIGRIKDIDQYDIVITSGGASVGEADFFEEALQTLGAEILFHGINLKPGRPMLCAKYHDTLIFSLPGNPLSGILNLISLVLPTLFKLSGSLSYFTQGLCAKHKGEVHFKGQRSHIVLGTFDGKFFIPFQKGKYGSGSLKPLQASNALAIFDESVSTIYDNQDIYIISIPPLFTNLKNTIFNNSDKMKA